jgi:hypothetical protein
MGNRKDQDSRLNAQVTWRASRLTDPAGIREFLSSDREYAAFALADLEPALFSQCSWYGAETMGELRALALVYRGLEPPALFLMGDTTGLALMFGSLLREQHLFAACKPEHLPILEAYYAMGEVEPMRRMVLEPTQFRIESRHDPEQLTLASIAEINALYDTDRSHKAWFQPYQVEQGFFYGIREMGQLVAVSGSHLASLSEGIAVVGNVFTHPDCRRRGYAYACTARVTEALLSQNNPAAARIYEHLGYVDHCTFLEAPVMRRTLR